MAPSNGKRNAFGGQMTLESSDLDSNLVSPTAGSYLSDLDPVTLSSLYLTSVIDEVGILASQLIT